MVAISDLGIEADEETIESLSDAVDNMEIAFAKWNADTDSFDGQTFLTDGGDAVVMNPTLAADGGKITAIWAEAIDCDLLGFGGTYTVVSRTLENGAWGAPVELFTTDDYYAIVELAGGYHDGGLQVAFAAFSRDTGPDATDVYARDSKPDIWLWRDGEIVPLADTKEASGLQFADGLFYWQAGGQVHRFDISDSSWGPALADAAVSGSFKIVSGGGKTALAWAEAGEDGNYCLKASILDGEVFWPACDTQSYWRADLEL